MTQYSKQPLKQSSKQSSKQPKIDPISYNSTSVLLVGFLLVAALIGSAHLAQAQVVAPPTGERLRTAAGSFLVGYASRDNFLTLPDTTQYQATASSEFNFLTPENQLKFDATEPSQNSFNFAPGDTHVAFAQANGMRVKGHNLIWHQQVPGWVTAGNFNAAQLTAILQNHIANVVGHYKGKLFAWDVVNEAFNDDGSRASSVWQNTIGNNHIDLAFQAAHAADPGALLNYNDFNIETVNTKSSAVLAMVQDFKNRGIPIDGVGFEMHLAGGGIDVNSLTQNMARFAAAGVKIFVSEMDVRETVPASAATLQSQATVYSNVLKACLAQPACVAFTTWGFTDKYSWIPGTFSGQGQALPFDESYAAKPAYFAMQSALGGSGATPDFSLSATPATVTQGGTATSTITITRTNGFTGNVALTATGLPGGVTPSFNPASVSGTSSTLTFTASASATTGAASVTITGTSGTLSHTTKLTLLVNPIGDAPDFSLSATPATVTVTQGGTATSTITITRINGFSGNVALTATGLPGGVTPSFNPVSVSATSTLTFTASATAITGPATVTIVGIGGGSLMHTAPLTLTVNPSGGGGNGGVTLTPVVNSNGPFFDDEGLKIANTAPITALSVTITVQTAGGVTFSGLYNTVGGSITQGHSSNASTITYTYSLSPGQTLSPGMGWLFDAQMGGSGGNHPAAGDTFTVVYTTGGTQFTRTGQF